MTRSLTIKIAAAVVFAVACVTLFLYTYKGPAIIDERVDLGPVTGTMSCRHYDYCYGTKMGSDGSLKSGYGWRMCSGSQAYRGRLIRETYHYEREPHVSRVREYHGDRQPTEECS